MLILTRSVARITATAASAFAIGACASSGGVRSADSGSDIIPAITFSPSLDVQLSEMTRRMSGLYVVDFDAGTGAPATAGDLLRVRYTVHLANGTRAGGTAPDQPPFEFRLGNGQVVRGWDEGLTGLRVGGRRRLIIPPSLGYGARRRGEIPANSVMVVDVRLVEIGR